MRIPLPLRPALPVLALAFATTCQSPPATHIAEADREAIRRASDRWAEAATARDFAAVAALYAEDAALLPANGEVLRGRAAIQAWFEQFPPFTDLDLRQVELDGCGGLAYVWGSYSMNVTLPGGSPFLDRGKYIEIWRKQPDGSWRIARDIYNSDLPLESPEGATP